MIDRRFAGGSTYYRVDVGDDAELLVAVTGRHGETPGEEVAVQLIPGATARAFRAE